MGHFSRSVGAIAFIVLLSGCATAMRNDFNSTLWMQTAAEYKADTMQTYRMAIENIDRALEDHGWSAAIEQKDGYSSLQPAIVMDIDETVLDNSRYEAMLILEGKEFDQKTWDDWIAFEGATAVPGAVEFINDMRGRDIEVVYITNRACAKRENSALECPQEGNTIENLKKVGVLGVRPENILLAGEVDGWTSEKKSRREFVSGKYRIVMLFGDDLGDFLPDVKDDITPEQREKLVDEYGSNWGKRWFILPNPIYGSWLSVLKEPKFQYLIAY
jgi:5'-nucleotidase (lipoprotein e(P4) family)